MTTMKEIGAFVAKTRKEQRVSQPEHLYHVIFDATKSQKAGRRQYIRHPYDKGFLR